jgi:replication factor A1
MIDEKELQTTADKIIKLFKEKSIDVSKKDVMDGIKALVNSEYDLPLLEGAKIVTRKYARMHNIDVKFAASSGEVSNIGELIPNTWVTVEGKIMSVNKPDNKRIHQTAIMTDSTGTIKVTVWNRTPEEPRVPDLKINKWYKINDAVVNAYKGDLSIGVQKNTMIAEIDAKENITSPVVKVEELKPGIVTLIAKVVKLFEPKSPKVSQSGYIGDDTGTVQFVIWASQPPKTKLEEGKVYEFHMITASQFNDKLSVIIGSDVKPSKKTFEVKSTTTSFTGAMVNIKEGSGIVKRCTVPNCGRVLSNMNYCNEHEIQKDFKYDMRIRGILDNGYVTKDIYIPSKIVEELMEMTLDQAIEVAENNPLGPSQVFMDVQEKFLGRYFVVEGNDINDRIIATKVTPVTEDGMKLLTGMDFKITQTKLEV